MTNVTALARFIPLLANLKCHNRNLRDLSIYFSNEAPYYLVSEAAIEICPSCSARFKYDFSRVVHRHSICYSSLFRSANEPRANGLGEHLRVCRASGTRQHSRGRSDQPSRESQPVTACFLCTPCCYYLCIHVCL